MENVVNYILIGLVVLMLIALPIMMNSKNKKETQKMQEQTNSLKIGDKVLTTSGVYGTITELKFDDTQKLVVIETGGKVKSYMTVDAYAIYTVFKSEEELRAEALRKEEEEKAKLAEKEAKKNKKSEVVEVVTEEVAENVENTSEHKTESAEEVKVEETKVNETKTTKKTKKK